jgi:uncharacterized protein
LADAPFSEEDAASERTCIVSREVRDPDAMIRFVRGPAGEVVPDIRRKLPGRGVWVTATAAMIGEALRKKAFGRAFRAEVSVDPDMPALVDALLAEYALQSLAMANKAGRVLAGFGKVETALRAGQPRALLHASDAAPDGKRKLAQAMRGEPVLIEIFSAEQLSLALGRPHVIHAALLPGPVSAAFIDRCDVLARFRGVPLSGAASADMGLGDLQAAPAARNGR